MTDFNKLLKFAKLIGVAVVEKSPNGEDAAVFTYGKTPEIEIYSKGRKTHYLTLVLLHELGHAVDWAQMGRPRAREIPKALARDAARMTPSDRRVVFEYESRAIENMKLIYRLLDLKVPLWKLERERRFDQWIAQTLLNTGAYPTGDERKAFLRALRRSVNQQTINSLSLI